MDLLKNSDKKVVGMKQTLRSLESDNVEAVYLAQDADLKIIEKIVEAAKSKKVKVIEVPTMDELGKCCNVKVSTATCAILKN